MTRDDIQPAWVKIVDLGFSDYANLNKEQRVWFNIEPLTTDGLWDHYVNYGADKNAETIDDLKHLGFESVANQLEQFNSKYFPGGVPQGPNARQEQFDKYSQEQLEIDITEMDNQFWNMNNELENGLLEYIKKTGIGQP